MEKAMDKLKIARINELYKKSKTEGLTETEKEEQKQLRNEYRMAVINNLHSSLNNVSIENEDGTITELKTKVITKEIRKIKSSLGKSLLQKEKK